MDFQSINVDALKKSFNLFGSNKPFNHVVVDNFLTGNLAHEISGEFLDFNSSHWVKKALYVCDLSRQLSDQLFSFFNSQKSLSLISNLKREDLSADSGLNGAGWHIHDSNVNLNAHYDHSIQNAIQIK